MDDIYDVEVELQNLFLNGEIKDVPRRFLVLTTRCNIWCDDIIVYFKNDADHDVRDKDKPPMGIIKLLNGKTVFVFLYDMLTVYDFASLKPLPESPEDESRDPVQHLSSRRLDERMYT